MFRRDERKIEERKERKELGEGEGRIFYRRDRHRRIKEGEEEEMEYGKIEKRDRRNLKRED
jgi:hypothetical protein